MKEIHFTTESYVNTDGFHDKYQLKKGEGGAEELYSLTTWIGRELLYKQSGRDSDTWSTDKKRAQVVE